MPDTNALATRLAILQARAAALSWLNCTDMPGRISDEEYAKRFAPVADEINELINLRDAVEVA